MPLNGIGVWTLGFELQSTSERKGIRCATSWCDLDLTFDLAVVTLTYIKSYPGYISETVRCSKLILGMDIGWGV